MGSGLFMDLTISLVKLPRRRCPRCGHRRVLYKLIAFGKQAVGDGLELCAVCGGLR